MIDYENLVNRNIKRIKPSGIRKFFDIANEMDDVISLSVGEPDFHTPWHIREAGIESLEKGRTSYTPNRGFLRLRAEVSNFLERHYTVKYDPQTEILVTVGGSEAIDLGVRSLINPGDEVLIPEPSFVCYVPITEMAGGVPVIIETKPENKFRLTAQELEEKITDRTKLLIMPYPNNPTGAVMRRSDLEAIAQVVERHNLLVLSDEIYASLTYGEERLDLSRNEYRILQVLLENKGKTVSRETLMRKLWETDSFVDENTLSVNVNRLRRKLEGMGLGDFIRTKKGMGYLVE